MFGWFTRRSKPKRVKLPPRLKYDLTWTNNIGGAKVSALVANRLDSIKSDIERDIKRDIWTGFYKDKDAFRTLRMLDACGITEEEFVGFIAGGRNPVEFDLAFISYLEIPYILRAYLAKWKPHLKSSGVTDREILGVLVDGIRRGGRGFQYIWRMLEADYYAISEDGSVNFLEKKSDRYFSAITARGYTEFKLLREAGLSVKDVEKSNRHGIDSDLAISVYGRS